MFVPDHTWNSCTSSVNIILATLLEMLVLMLVFGHSKDDKDIC